MSVVSWESVWIALTIAALYDLDVLACDIQNANLADLFTKMMAAPKRERLLENFTY